MRNRLSIFFVLLCFSFSFVKGQNELAPLFAKIKSANNDTHKVALLNELSWELFSVGSNDSAFMYAAAAESLAVELSEVKINGWQIGLASAKNKLGVICFNRGDYSPALQYYFEALKLMEAMHDKKGIASVHNGIGNTYAIQNNFKPALEHHFMALKIREDLGNSKGMANSLGNLGNVFYSMGKFPEALEYYVRCLKLMEQDSNKQGMANVYGNLGVVYLEQKNYKEALANQYKALTIHNEINDRLGQEITWFNISAIHLKQKLFAEAVQYGLKAMAGATETGDRETLKDIHHTLSEAYEALGKSEEALTHFKDFIVLRDSLKNEENTKETVRLEMNYEFGKKEAASKLEQDKKEAIAATEIKKQKIVLFSVSGIGILTLIFALFAYRSFLQKRNANIKISRQKELIEEKQKEILDSIHYARRIQTALLTSDRYIARNLKKHLKV